MQRIVASLIFLLIVLGANTLVSAKGITTRVRIAGATLAEPVDLTEPGVLASANVWSGPGTFVNDVEATDGFIIDWASGVVTEPPATGQSFDVSFYVTDLNGAASRQPEHLAYVVRFRMAANGGYIYLPGPADEFYRLNAATILRGSEGRWFHSTREWDQAIRKRVQIASAHAGR